MLLLFIIFKRQFCRGEGSSVATKMKGIFKGIKYISQIFAVYKEHEMEIGYPTDVKHVSHLGWDGSSMNAPSWMNALKTSSDFTSTQLSNLCHSRDPSLGVASWSSQGDVVQPQAITNMSCNALMNASENDFQQSLDLQPASAIFGASPPSDPPKVPKKTRQKKGKDSSPSSTSRSSRRSSKSKGSFAAVEESEATDNPFGIL